jgi:hypothetical protein
MPSFRVEMYYVYFYLREDYSPYYVGKGSGKRSYTKGPKEVKPPKDKSRVKIIKADLTEEEAFLLEKLYILMFGRIDLGTGILRNKSDGGDGASGRIASPEERRKRSERMKGVTRPQWIYEKIAASNTGKKASAETRAKQSAARKGRKCTEEHKRNVSKAKASPHKITFADGREIIVENLMNYARETDYHFTGLYNVKLGYRKKHKDIIKVELVN